MFFKDENSLHFHRPVREKKKLMKKMLFCFKHFIVAHRNSIASIFAKFSPKYFTKMFANFSCC